MLETPTFSSNTVAVATFPPTLIKRQTEPAHTQRHHLALFLQALHHFHYPNDHNKLGSGSTIKGNPSNTEGGFRKVQTLQRNLKPDKGPFSYNAQALVSLIIFL